MIGKRKKLLQDMGSAMALEVREPLKIFGDAAVQDGVADLEKKLKATTLKEEAEWYNADANFESAVKSAMEAKRNVLDGVDRFSMDAPLVDLSGWSLAEPRNMEKLLAWLQAGPAATEVRCEVRVALPLVLSVVVSCTGERRRLCLPA